MTDRIHALTVVLDSDIRDDDVQPLIDAIRCLRRVVSVEAHVADVSLHTAQMRADTAWKQRLLDLVRGGDS